MGFIGDLFGTASGNTGGAGMRFDATGADPGQISQAWANTQTGLANQNAFLGALAAQGGINNQSNVFQQQQALANMLQQQAAGGGPNPAQAQYQQNVNQLAQQQGAAIGAQKGINPGLAARLIAQQGGAAKQNAAGQQATLQAQQQLAAQQALMQQQAQMGALASQQVGQTQQAISGYTQGALGQQGNVLGIQGSANSANAGVAGNVANQQGKMFGGLLGGIGSAIGLADGGMVPDPKVPRSMAGKGLAGYASGGAIQGEAYAHQMKPVPGKAAVAGDSGKNDTVPAKLSPGEVIIPRSVMHSDDPVKNAAKFVAAVMAKNGRLK